MRKKNFQAFISACMSVKFLTATGEIKKFSKQRSKLFFSLGKVGILCNLRVWNKNVIIAKSDWKFFFFGCSVHHLSHLSRVINCNFTQRIREQKRTLNRLSSLNWFPRCKNRAIIVLKKKNLWDRTKKLKSLVSWRITVTFCLTMRYAILIIVFFSLFLFQKWPLSITEDCLK